MTTRILLLALAAAACLSPQASASPAAGPPSSWTRHSAGEVDGVSVTLLVAPRATAADETFIAFELTNGSSSPVMLQSLECGVSGTTVDARGRSFDTQAGFNVSAILDPSRPGAGSTLPPSRTIVVRGDTSAAAATLGVPGMSRNVYRKGHPARMRRVPDEGLKLKALAWVRLSTVRASTSRTKPLAIEMDWDPVDARGMEAVLARVTDAVRHAPATPSERDDAFDWIAIPELAQRVTFADLLAGLDARATGWADGSRTGFLVDALRERAEDRSAVVSFLRERLERGSPDAIGWLLNAPWAWEEDFRPAVTRLARSGVVPQAGPLLASHPLPTETAGPRSLLLPVMRPKGSGGDTSRGVLPDTIGVTGWLFETPEPARDEPALAGGEILFLTSDAQVWAVDAITGEERWRRALRVTELAVPQDYFGSGLGWPPWFGSAGSPRLLGCGTHAVLQAARLRGDGTQAWLTGLDPRTGEIAWERAAGDTVLPAPGANACLVVTMSWPDMLSTRAGSSRIELVDAASGKTRWARTLRGTLSAGCVTDDLACCVLNAADRERLVVIDLESGRLRTRAIETDIPRPETSSCFADRERLVTVTRSRPESCRGGGGPALMRCWDLGTLELAWSETPNFGPLALREGLLLGVSERLVAIDAGSGKEAWGAKVAPMRVAMGEDIALIELATDTAALSLLDPSTGESRARVPGQFRGLAQRGATTFATSERGLLAIGRAPSEAGVPIRSSEASRREQARIAWERPLARLAQWPSLVAAGDHVIMGSGGDLEVLDATNGTTAWTSSLASSNWSSKLLATTEVVITRVRDDIVGLSSATGERVWSAPLRWYSDAGPLAAGSGLVLMGTSLPDASGGLVRALDAKTGQIAWDFPLGAQSLSAAAIRGGVAVFAYHGGELAAFDAATGRSLWSAKAPLRPPGPSGSTERIDAMRLAGEDSSTVILEIGGNPSRVIGLHGPSGSTWSIDQLGPVTVDGSVVRPGTDSRRIKAFAIDARSGDRLWDSAPVPGDNLPPAVHGDTLYYGNLDGHVRAVDRASREILWTTRLPARIYWLGIAGGNVIAACGDGRMVALRIDAR